jgi:trans-aconitate methyltransferase
VLDGKPGYIAGIIDAARQLNRDWSGKAAGGPAFTPFMPFPLIEFAALLLEALPAADGDKFLDVGCGPGAGLLIARDLCGLREHGIDLNPELAVAARALGLSAEAADAEAWDRYGDYDITWLNRPLRDRDRELALEKRIWDAMAPGAVVICANLEEPPPSRWYTVLDAWDSDRRGIWAKVP